MTNPERAFRALIEHGGDLLVLHDAEARILYVSPSARRILGREPEELVGTDAFAYVHPDDVEDNRERLRNLVATPGERMTVSYRLRHADGSIRWMEASGQNLLSDPDVAAIVINARDVTEQLRLETQLRRSQMMEAVGRLAGGIAHDFNNLLGIVRAAAESLVRGVSHPQDVEERARMICDATDKGAALTQHLLALGRTEITRTERVELDEVLHGACEMWRRVLPEDIELVLDTKAPGGTLEVDLAQLEQVLLNLVVNARDAMPEGGRLTMRTRVEDGQLSLAVEDDGIGMDETTRAHAFEPFFTTKEAGAGSGLGLSLVHAIVERGGGTVDLWSEPGGGTRLTFRWPLASGEPDAVTRPGRERAPRGQESVLLVEDEEQLATLVAEMLREHGYEVCTASGVDEALRRVEELESPLDVVVTDVVMPGAGGRELTERLHEHRPGLPVLYVSGHPEDEVLRRGLSKRSIHFLAKPFSAQDLLWALRRLLDTHT